MVILTFWVNVSSLQLDIWLDVVKVLFVLVSLAEGVTIVLSVCSTVLSVLILVILLAVLHECTGFTSVESPSC